MKSLLALGLIAALPILAIYSLFYFGFHGLLTRISSKRKAILETIPCENFNRETASIQ